MIGSQRTDEQGRDNEGMKGFYEACVGIANALDVLIGYRRSSLSAASIRTVWPNSSAEAGQNFQSSLPDTADGKCTLLLALALTVESLTALPKVVEPRGSRIIF